MNDYELLISLVIFIFLISEEIQNLNHLTFIDKYKIKLLEKKQKKKKSLDKIQMDVTYLITRHELPTKNPKD